jgi:hypothetical protein
MAKSTDKPKINQEWKKKYDDILANGVKSSYWNELSEVNKHFEKLEYYELCLELSKVKARYRKIE